MRKPRNIDAELKVLSDKAKELKARRTVQLGELVCVTGADALDLEVLAGALLAAIAGAQSVPTKEAWRAEGAAFFQGRTRRRKSAGPTASDGAGSEANPDRDGQG
jgi:hypothetical protein